MRIRIFTFGIMLTSAAWSHAFSQSHVSAAVFGNGGAPTANGDYRVTATIGQQFAGLADSGSGSVGSGFWYNLTQTVTTDADGQDDGLPVTFRLDQNYPNPFNPATTIRFAVPRPARITITVFNILGQRVALLLDEEQGPGEHTLRFHAEGIPSGVYFCTMKARGSADDAPLFSDVMKLMVLK